MRIIKSTGCIFAAAILLSGCFSETGTTDVDYSNQQFVDAQRYSKSGQIDKAYDIYHELIETYPHTQGAVLSVQPYADLKPFVEVFGVKKDTERYPQSSVEALLNSVVLAADNNDYRYLAAHLIMFDWKDATQKKFDEAIAAISPDGRFHERFMEYINAVKLVLKEKTEPSEYNYRGVEGVEYSNELARFAVMPLTDHIYQMRL